MVWYLNSRSTALIISAAQQKALALFFDTRLRMLQLQRRLLSKRAKILQYQL